MSFDLVRYDAMCHAIAECHQIDEVKDLRDKAMALELYAKQARNTDAERKASEVRLRAERRTGELLKELARAPSASGGDVKSAPKRAEPIDRSPYAKALADTGISTQTASRYQALANVPQPVFEEALRDPVVKPTTAALIRQARDPEPQIDRDALWIWGRVRDFEREGYTDKNPVALLEKMTETMQSDMARIVPLMADFFNRLNEAIHEPA